MKVLVTGGAGFVGRHFVRRLLEKDDNEVLIIDSMVNGVPVDSWMFKPKNLDRLTFKQADCRNWFKERKSDPGQFDLVINCAAIVGGRMKIDFDPLAVATNMSIDSEFFDWVVRTSNKPKVVYFSSSAVYPLEYQTEQDHVPLVESMVTFDRNSFGRPDKTYGFCKLAGEFLADFAKREYGLDVHVYRPFGGFGPDQDFNYPFPSIIRRVIDGENPVTVWGSGRQQRDFIYIEDVIDVVLGTLRGEHGPLNVGTGKATSFLALAEMACRLLGCKSPLKNDPDKPEGVFSRVADVTRMRAATNGAIQRSLADGIMRVAKAMGA